MRLIERLIVLSITIAAIAFLLLHSPPPIWLKVVIMATFLLIPLHAWLEGVHWQLAPAYLASGLLLFSLASLGASQMASTLLAVAALVLVSMSLVLSWALPMFKLPTPTGEYPIGTRTLYLTDHQREEMHAGAPPGKRQLVVQLWYPAKSSKGRRARYRQWKETKPLSSYQAVLETHAIENAQLPEGRFAVLVFNHAWRGFRNRTTFLAQELASHGFVVAAVSHTYNASIVALSDGTVARSQQFDIGFCCPTYIPLEERRALADEELQVQVDDCSFVLDELQRFNKTPGHPFEQHLNFDQIGTYGHSFGGAVSVELAKLDPRVKCALQLDGVFHGTSSIEGISKPLMVIDSDVVIASPEPPADPDPLVQSNHEWARMSANAKMATLANLGGYRVFVDGISHENFSDSSFMSPLRKLSHAGPMKPHRTAEILNTCMLAFFNQTLRNQPSRLLSQGIQPFPEATLTIYMADANAASISELSSRSN
jgi:dienelactone hydrolase